MGRRLAIWAVLAAVAGPLFPAAGAAHARSLPPGFHDTLVWKGLDSPTTVRFAPDGKVFVGEQDGRILVYASVHATRPKVFADLRADVYDYDDSGLESIAIDPHFPRRPYIYVDYTRNATIDGQSPRWGNAREAADPCPKPPSQSIDGCTVSGRLVRLTARGDHAVHEKVLIDDWCDQYDTHSVGDLAFAPDGTLYMGAGDGANESTQDWGQLGGTLPGDQVNPCGDGTRETVPGAEGGALRAQVLTPDDGAPVSLDGKLIRVNPATGAGAAGNPLAASSSADLQRVIADGFRQPFRFTFRPGTGELWVADVGWGAYEEIDRVPARHPAVSDFGWPCDEGPGPEPGWASYHFTLCDQLYAGDQSVMPYYDYPHVCETSACPVRGPASSRVAGHLCATGSGAITGIQFYAHGPFPREYHGALFFADFDRGCLYVMPRGPGGLPDPKRVRPFDTDIAAPVDLQRGPGGALYYVSIAGQVRKISYTRR